MPCESCAVQFSVFKRKRVCSECDRYYCSSCLRRGGGIMCGPCRILSTRPLVRQALGHLKVRDLQCFLHHHNVSTRGCVEKDDLVSLAMSHVNSSAYKRRPQRSTDFSNAFSSLKDFTSNINVLINNAFDIRPPDTSSSSSTTASASASNTYSSSASASATATATGSSGSWPSTSGHTARTTTTPARSQPSRTTADRPSQPAAGDAGSDSAAQRLGGSTPEIVVSPGSGASEAESSMRETQDCLEIEDLDDAAEWEFVRRPAEPLPNDSNVLIAENDLPEPSPIQNRASSELDLRRSESNDTNTDTASLKDEPFTNSDGTPKRVRLDDLKTMRDVDLLNVKQLKELLALNRVDYKGCVERKELLERAKRLWKESAKSREGLNSLPIEECCKICMDAPLECVLLECGHIATCTDCGKKLSECPICRQYVVRCVRFFRS